ncbi:hypothetical protein ACYOEI_05315, partial [Singulisphaera rosea]
RRGAGRLMVSSPFAKLAVASQFLGLELAAVSVERGRDAALGVKINKAVDFEGEAKVTLIGLPNKVTTDVATITKDSSEIVFRLKTDPTSPVGETTSLFCQVVIMKDGQPILHNLGSGRLRIDAALPSTKSSPAAKPVVASAGTSTTKPLSRLEKLRFENQERTKAVVNEGTRAPQDQGAVLTPQQP